MMNTQGVQRKREKVNVACELDQKERGLYVSIAH